MDDLLDNNTGFVVICLVPESDESSNNVYNDSYEDDEDKESDENSIYSCSVWTRSCFFACSIADFASCRSSGTCCSLFVQASISACSVCSSASFCDLLTRLYSLEEFS